MGRKCCVPGCSSNYNNETHYTTVFHFPVEPVRRNQWIRSINRAVFNPSSSAVVCVKHFEERFILREDRAVRDDGSVLVVQRKRLGITSDAYPTIFENQPSYLTKALPAERKAPNQRLQEILNRDEQEFVQWCTEDTIESFEQFKNEFSSKVTNGWLFLTKINFVLVYKIQDTECPNIVVAFKVYQDLTLQIYHKNVALDMKSFQWLLDATLKCDRWTKFDNLLSLLSSYNNPEEFTLEQKLSCAITFIENCCSDEKSQENEELHLKLNFIKQQMLLLSMKRLRYPTDMILWCFNLYFMYPAAYNFIRESKILTLPHPCSLKKLSSVCEASCTDNSHVAYLKKKADLLKDHEKIVSLLIDEIYVNPLVQYKSGRLYGISENSNSVATTIQAFMITSVLSKNKDVVSLVPVLNITANILHKYTSDILKILDDCGFTVLSIISDNNSVNRNMFTAMCGGELKPFINHPNCPKKRIFLLFDSVHLIKSIRNNWLNQKTPNQTFYYPSPSVDNVSCASLSSIKTIYESERNCVAKLAPKLSEKVLYPTSIERQNVTYAVNLFHATNIVALEMNKEKLDNAISTKIFIEYILNWWKIMNVKHPFKCILSRDDMSSPISSVSHKSCIFLQDFSSWLSKWMNYRKFKKDEKKNLGIPSRGGMLTNETFTALKLTTDSTIEMIKYIFETFGPSYILLGKFQTDNLEARFGQYRQMSGGNYNISCLQVLESEKKLKILSMISLYSESKGNFTLKNLGFELNAQPKNCEIPEDFYEVFNSVDDIDIPNETMSVLVYIAGYVAHKVCINLKCKQCVSLLIRDRILQIECPNEDIFTYLNLCNRGALKWPQDTMIISTVSTFQIFQKLIGNKFENAFIKYKEQKTLLTQLALEKLELLGVGLHSTCSCGNNSFNLIKQGLSGLANIFHNNYAKIRNNNRKTNSTKRKLSTLIK